MSSLPFQPDDVPQSPRDPQEPSNSLVPTDSPAVDSSAADTRAMALVALMTDGDLSPQEQAELRTLLKANPGLLQSYVEQAVAHAVLEWRYVQAPAADESASVETADPAQTFTVHGALTLRPLAGGGSGGVPVLPPPPHAQLPDASRPGVRRRWPLLAIGFLAGAGLVAATLAWSPWTERHQAANPQVAAPPAAALAGGPQIEPRLPAVYVGFESLSAIGGTLRKQLDPKKVAWVPQGLVYPKLACNGGALKIDGAHDQYLWLDLDADMVVPPDREDGALARVGVDRGRDVAWPRSQRMGTPGTTLYLSFLIRTEQPVASGLCGLSFAYGNYENLFVGKARGVAGFSYDFAAAHKTLLNADPSKLANKPIPLDTTTHLIVTRVDFRDADDRFAIYFDPDPTAPEPKQPNATGVGKIAFDRIRISAGRGVDRHGGGVWYLDEIRLADRYRAAVPTVGPSAAAKDKTNPSAGTGQ